MHENYQLTAGDPYLVYVTLMGKAQFEAAGPHDAFHITLHISFLSSTHLGDLSFNFDHVKMIRAAILVNFCPSAD